jgi:hypothetical protein
MTRQRSYVRGLGRYGGRGTGAPYMQAAQA